MDSSITQIPSDRGTSTCENPLSPDNLPIVGNDSPSTASGQTTEEAQEARPNKYIYPLFAGYAGERYLDTIVQQILPSALHRTWYYAVDFQAPGKPCYVGTQRLANRVKPGVRKIELDFQELERRGLMRRIGARQEVMQDDGSFKEVAVIIKDFSALYALAVEYHEWLESPQYLPPQKGFKALIEADNALYEKLLRFDIYRRMLKNDQPGPKPRMTATQQYYQQEATTSQESSVQTTPTAQNPNLYLDPSANDHSAYRTPVPSNEGEVITLSNIRAANAGLREGRSEDAKDTTTVVKPVEAIGNVEATSIAQTEDQTVLPDTQSTHTLPSTPEHVVENRRSESPRVGEKPARAKTVLHSSSGLSSTGDILATLNITRRVPTREERAAEEQRKEALRPRYDAPPLTQADLDAQGRGRAAILRKAQTPAAHPLSDIIPSEDWKVLNRQLTTNTSTDGEYPDWLVSSVILVSRALKDDEHIPSNKSQVWKIYGRLPQEQRNPDQFVKYLYTARARVVERQAKGKNIPNPFGYAMKCLKNDLGIKEGDDKP
jgi:hypothetical protein